MTLIRGSVPPIVCTLTDDFVEGGIEWTELLESAILTNRVDGGAAVTFPSGLAAKVEELAQVEANCCGTWMRVETSHSEHDVTVSFTSSNPDGVALITSMAGLLPSDC